MGGITALPLQSGEPTGNDVFDGLRQKFSELSPEQHQALAQVGMHPFLQPKDPTGAPISFTPPPAPKPADTLAANPQTTGAIPSPTPESPALTPVRGIGAPMPSLSPPPSGAPAGGFTPMPGAKSVSGPPTPIAAPRPAMPRLTTNLSSDQANLQNAIASKSGLQKLPGIARIPLQILQGIAMATKPGQNILPFIPGTDPHHAAQIAGWENVVKNDIATEDAASKRAQEAAQAGEQTAQGEAVTAKTPAEIANLNAEAGEHAARS